MGTSAPGICWPSRFWIKWVSLLLGGIVLGMIIAASTHRSAPSVQAEIEVAATYQGSSQKQRIAANLYYINEKGETGNSGQVIQTSPSDYALKTDAAGRRVQFQVEQVDIVPAGDGRSIRQPVGPRVYWTGPWAQRQNEIMTITVDLPYPKPKLHY